MLPPLWDSGALRRATAPADCDPSVRPTVADRRVVAHDQDVVALTLVGADAAELPSWRTGAHLDIHLPSGRVRQYSLCGDPARRDAYRIAVRRIPDGGGGSAEVHDMLRVGATVTTNAPRNAFADHARLRLPHAAASVHRRGIGVATIRPMLGYAEYFGG